MKKLFLLLSIFAYTDLTANGGGVISDPVIDYISNFSFYDGKKTIYSNDHLLRLDLDLNNSGQNEILLSMSRDTDGKGGNVWDVYKQTTDGYLYVGGMTFDPSSFYLGNIDGLGKYGLVSFWSGGAGGGQIYAQIYDGSKITETNIAAIRQDSSPGQGRPQLLDRYFGTNAINGEKIMTTITADEMAKKYGVKLDPRTYEQSLEESLAAETPSASKPPTTAHLTPQSSPTAPSPIPIAKVETSQSFPWPWTIGVSFLLLGGVIWFLYTRLKGR